MATAPECAQDSAVCVKGSDGTVQDLASITTQKLLLSGVCVIVKSPLTHILTLTLHTLTTHPHPSHSSLTSHHPHLTLHISSSSSPFTSHTHPLIPLLITHLSPVILPLTPLPLPVTLTPSTLSLILTPYQSPSHPHPHPSPLIPHQPTRST